jgi:SAM-dependent methyltransferase
VLPPVELRVRVGCSEDADVFLTVGQAVFADLNRLLGAVGRTLDGFANVLDFGCGCGRVLRFFPRRAGLVGCDIDAEAIAWCQQALGDRARFYATMPRPPLPFDDRSFDLAYAISVFTHLPEEMQFLWLEELARLLRPGGILIASTHGETLLPANTPEAVRRILKRTGFLYTQGQSTPGLPDFYQTTFHLRRYVEEKWTRHFRLASAVPRGINSHQDAYVLERRPVLTLTARPASWWKGLMRLVSVAGG